MRSPRRPAPLSSTESSGWNPLIARKIAGLRVRAGVGWGRRPFLLMVSRLESLDVMYPYMRGSVLSRSMSCIRACGALGALSSEVPATAGVSTLDPPGSDFELGQKTRPRCRECPSSPTRTLYARPQSHGPKSGWRRRRTLGTCRAGLRMAAGLWAGARLGLRAS